MVTRPHPSLLLILIVILAGCASQPQQQSAPITPAPSSSNDLQQRAEAALAGGQYGAATQLFLNAANAASPDESIMLRLRAGDAASLAEDDRSVERILSTLPTESLNPMQRQWADLLDAERLIRKNQSRAALEYLRSPVDSAPASLAARLGAAQARAFIDLGDTVSGVRSLVAREKWLSSDAAILENRTAIWESLRYAPLESDVFQRLQEADQTTRGWVELALLSRSIVTQPEEDNSRLTLWRARYPDHPGIARVLPQDVPATASAWQPGKTVALLLPASGKFAAAAASIREGFLTASFNAGSPITLRLYDTQGNPETALSAAQTAIAEGADLIVGPLQREAVAAFAAQPSWQVPVLALNYPDNPGAATQGLYRLGLSPLDEAHQVAEQATNDQYQRAVALVPDNAWGHRVAQAFESSLRQRGGELMSIGYFDEQATDYAAPIKKALNLDESRQRHRVLSDVLGEKLRFEPRRRNDIDFIFLAARPKQARLIRPQIKFFRADRLPVYSLSKVYDGGAEPAKNRDLDGIRFCDIPWLLSDDPELVAERKASEKLWPNRAIRFPRLVALGRDAFLVAPFLENGQLQSGFYLPAATGKLFLRSNGDIARSLDWAEFRRGVAEPLAPAEDIVPSSQFPSSQTNQTSSPQG